MKIFTPVYIPAGVGTFHMETADRLFAESSALLKQLDSNFIIPEDKLLSTDAVDGFLDSVSPDLVVFQHLTFANGAYMAEVLRRYRGPLVIWTLREPESGGGRLRLNSLTGAFSAAHTAAQFGGLFSYIFGSPSESSVRTDLLSVIHAAKIIHDMKSLKIAAIGQTPQGFGFGRALDTELMSVFGAELVAIEARELIEKAKGFSEDEASSYLDRTASMTQGFENTPEKNRIDHAKLYRAYTEFIQENHIGALASRCWPDFFTSFGTPVCTVLSLLGDDGVAAACEADIYGALSMWIGMKLSGAPSFFGDPVALDETENTITFWHCGAGACSLARKDTGATIGVHPNRKIGPAMDFGCEAYDSATIFRVGRKPDGTFRFFIEEGEILDKPKQYTGTSMVVRTDTPSRDLVERAVKACFEPHFAVMRGRHAAALTALAGMLGIEVWR